MDNKEVRQPSLFQDKRIKITDDDHIWDGETGTIVGMDYIVPLNQWAHVVEADNRLISDFYVFDRTQFKLI